MAEDFSSSMSTGDLNTTDSESGTVSFLLATLKLPTPSILARKRIVSVNPPLKGKRTCRGGFASASEPKNVSPSQWVKSVKPLIDYFHLLLIVLNLDLRLHTFLSSEGTRLTTSTYNFHLLLIVLYLNLRLHTFFILRRHRKWQEAFIL